MTGIVNEGGGYNPNTFFNNRFGNVPNVIMRMNPMYGQSGGGYGGGEYGYNQQGQQPSPTDYNSQQQNTNPQQTPPQTAPSTLSSFLPYILIGGGVLVLMMAMGGSKSGPAPVIHYG